MAVEAGSDFTATLVDPGGITAGVGARVEVPVTRAVVGYWRPASLSGFVWTVTLEAPLAAGDYQVVWRTDDAEPPEFEAFVPLFVTDASDPSAVAPVDWPVPDLAQVTPSVDDVAVLERTRTVGAGGDDAGTFTVDTNPTAGEVAGLIDRAVPVVLSQLRPTFPVAYYDEVRHAIALYAAVLVEGSFFREQVNQDAVALWRQLYQGALSGVQAGIDQDLQQLLTGRLA